jgi:regulator of sigma E protease
MAKLFGVRVDEFALGFPPRLKAWRRGGTEYSINAIPLGGFVKMAGENGEEDRPDSFGAKPQWQRLLILLAGPCMNLLLAVVVFFFSFLGGMPQTTTQIQKVAAQSPAAIAGLHKGDVIVAMAGKKVTDFSELSAIESRHIGHTVGLTVKRGASRFNTSINLRKNPPANQGSMGIALGGTTIVHYSPATALRMSVQQIGIMVSAIPTIIGDVIAGPGRTEVSGPIGIAHLTTTVVQAQPQEGWGAVFAFAALISANLGVMNLLPIPALDGGRIIFVIISWIRRRNLDPQVEGLIHMTGMALLLLLIVLISYQDIARWVTGQPY